MFEKEAKTKLSEEDYKLAEETIKPIYRNAIKNDYSFAKYGVECYLTGYNKANEWHFVKDGDLPKHEVIVLVLYNVQCIDIAHYNYDYKEWHFVDSIVRDVIAWKAIVLPELKESDK